MNWASLLRGGIGFEKGLRKITAFEIKQMNKIKIFFEEWDFTIRARIMHIKIDEIGNMMKKWKT